MADVNETAHAFGRKIIRLISNLERKRRRYINDGLREYGLQGSMFLYLTTLDTHPGSSQDFIAEHLGIDKSNVARTARKLEDNGYILRELSPTDRRQYCMYLTDKGKELLPVIFNRLHSWTEAVAGNLNDEERRTAIDLLERMMDNSIKNID